MDPMNPKSSAPMSNKPIAGMIFIMVVAVFVGGWLYVDSVRGELELRIDALASEIAASKMMAKRPPATPKAPDMSAFDENGFTFTYPSRLDGRLTCAQTGTADFGYDIEKLTRSWGTDGPSYKYDFWKATPLPDNADAAPFQALMMGMDPAQAGGPSCFIKLNQDDLTDAEAYAILQNIRVK